MPLTSGTATRVITDMDPQTFQTFCLWFLRDSGYEATIGPLRGPDGGQDITGIHRDVRFVAHCTTVGGQRSKLRTKLTRDVLDSRRSAEVFGEVVLCSVKRVGTPEEETAFAKTLHEALSRADQRYSSVHPAFVFLDAERLGLQVPLLPRGDSARLIAARLHSQLREAADELNSDPTTDGAFGTYKNCSIRTFEEWIDDPAWLGTTGRRGDIAADVLDHVWSVIAFSFRQATTLSRRELPRSLQPLLWFLIRAGMKLDVAASDAVALFVWLREATQWGAIDPGALGRSIELFTTRLVRWILYEQNELFADPLVREPAMASTAVHDSYWDVFWQDVELRQICHYISVAKDAAEMIRVRAGTAHGRSSDGPLHLLRPITSTLERT